MGVDKLEGSKALVKRFENRFVPKTIDIKLENQWVRLLIRTVEEKSHIYSG